MMTKAQALAELRALYTKIDALLEGWVCDSSTDCCRFGVTGREPYPTAVEVLALDEAVKSRGGSLPKRRRSLPQATENRCALLSDDGRCLVYSARPFGCRTFFCDRARGASAEESIAHLPKSTIAEVAREIATLSEKAFPENPGPRPMSRVTATKDWARHR